MDQKILHIAFKHGKEDNRIFRKECSTLAKKGYDVSYITSDINSENSCDEKQGVKRIVIPSNKTRVVRAFIYNHRIKQLIKKEKSIDLVHLHETTLLLIALWIKKRNIKVIYDSHEDYQKQIKASRGSFWASLYKQYEKYVCSRIDGVIFPCEMQERQVFDYPVRRLCYIDNYPIIDGNAFQNVQEKKEFLACYTGTITRTRGVDKAIKAWKKAGIRGIIAGNFGSQEDKTAIEGSPEFDCVNYIGSVPADQISQVYSQASIGMSVLQDVGQYLKSCNLPTKVGEYMMYGLPTVISWTPYVESVMKKYKFGIAVDPEDIDAITDAIIYLRDNPEERKRMIEEGFRAVREEFNWDTQGGKLANLYGEILNENITPDEKV